MLLYDVQLYTSIHRPLILFLCVHIYSILMRNADPKLSYWSSEEVEDVDSSDLRRNRFVGEGLGLLVVDETT